MYLPNRGMLRRGEQSVLLWEDSEILQGEGGGKKTQRRYSDVKKGSPEYLMKKYQAILVGSAVNNPSQSAIKVTLSFPDCKIYHPSTSRTSRRSFWLENFCLLFSGY